LEVSIVRVFTQIELADKQIPRPYHFLGVLSDLKHAFSQQKQSEEVDPEKKDLRLVGAVVIGSMARGSDMMCTSDIDILVFYDDVGVTAEVAMQYAKKNRTMFYGALEKATHYNVPVNIYNIYAEKLVARDTRHTWQFLRHAARSVEGFGGASQSGLLIGNAEDVVKIIRTAGGFDHKLALLYARDKREKLRDGYHSWGGLSQDAAAKLYGTIFTSPFHSVRQYLDCDGREYVDSKLGVVDSFAKYTSEETAEPLRRLLHTSTMYGQGCDVYRDDLTGRVQPPRLDFEQNFADAYQVLTSITELIMSWYPTKVISLA
jgi:predicted nucleotidyltransferase